MRLCAQSVAIQEIAPLAGHAITQLDLAGLAFEYSGVFDVHRVLGECEVFSQALRLPELVIDGAFEVELLLRDLSHLGIVVLLIFLIGRLADDGHRGVIRLVAAVQDAVHCIVVAARDRIEFVIVAACAGDGEAKEAAADDINAVIGDEQTVIDKAFADIVEA